MRSSHTPTPPATFESVTYEFQGTHLLRTVETVTETQYLPDGAFIPQRVVATRTSEVYDTDNDYAAGMTFAQALADVEPW